MKILMYLLLLTTAANCGSSQHQENNPPPRNTDVQEQNNDVLVGRIDRDDLQQAPHTAWFDPMYQSYRPDEEALKTIQENINDYEIKLFMGTWCADSQLEVPKFYKLLDQSEFNTENLEVIALTENKTTPNDLQEEYDVTYVPTIIFFKDGREVGRFVEYAQEELEEDIAKIVSGREYRHPYE